MIRDFLNTEEETLTPEHMPAAETAAEPMAETSARMKNTPSPCNLSVTDTLPVGMVYAVSQTYRELYTPEQALCNGTLFRELDLPFHGGMTR